MDNMQHHLDNPHLTYEEREGRGPLPEMATPGHLSMRFRRKLILAFETLAYEPSEYINAIGEPARAFNTARSNQNFLINKLRDYEIHVLEYLLSEISETDGESALYFIKGLLEDAPADGEAESVVNFCDYFLRDPGAGEVGDAIAGVFYNNPSAYAVVATQDTEGLPIRMLYPAIGEMSAEVMGEAISHIYYSDVKGVQTLLRQARDRLDDRDYAGGVERGYAAVESAAKQVALQRTGKAPSTLGRALDKIRATESKPDPAQDVIFDVVKGKIGRYANDEEGIRHSLFTKDAPDIGSAQALFFYAMCVMAADYLTSKLAEHPNGEGE